MFRLVTFSGLSLVAYVFIFNIRINHYNQAEMWLQAMHWSPLLVTAGVSLPAGLIVANGLWHLILRSIFCAALISRAVFIRITTLIPCDRSLLWQQQGKC